MKLPFFFVTRSFRVLTLISDPFYPNPWSPEVTRLEMIEYEEGHLYHQLIPPSESCGEYGELAEVETSVHLPSPRRVSSVASGKYSQSFLFPADYPKELEYLSFRAALPDFERRGTRYNPTGFEINRRRTDHTEWSRHMEALSVKVKDEMVAGEWGVVGGEKTEIVSGELCEVVRLLILDCEVDELSRSFLLPATR